MSCQFVRIHGALKWSASVCICETVSENCPFVKTVPFPEHIAFSQSLLYEMCLRFTEHFSFMVKLMKVYKTDKMLYFIKLWLRTQFCLFLAFSRQQVVT